MRRVGVLGLQGGFAAHVCALQRMGLAPSVVRRADQLDELDGLVLPGGESTTLLNLMRDEPWFEALGAFHARGGAMLATCAGMILLAREVRSPEQPSLGLLDVGVERNGYGRQRDSFEAALELAGDVRPFPAVFIRAPCVRRVGAEVAILAGWHGDPVLVRQGRILAATFHPELTDDDRLHRQFLDLVAGAVTSERTARF